MHIEKRNINFNHPTAGVLTKLYVVIVDNGIDLWKEPLTQNHPFWELDFDNLTPSDQEIIFRVTGYKIPISDLFRRKAKIDRVIAYLRAQATPAVFQTILNDTRTHRDDYKAGSDILIAWIQGVNSPVYGNFTTTGFPSKPYFSVARQTQLLAILT